MIYHKILIHVFGIEETIKIQENGIKLMNFLFFIHLIIDIHNLIQSFTFYVIKYH